MTYDVYLSVMQENITLASTLVNKTTHNEHTCIKGESTHTYIICWICKVLHIINYLTANFKISQLKPNKNFHFFYKPTTPPPYKKKKKNPRKGLYMIRIKFGPHDSTFLEVFQVYQIVLLFHGRVGIKNIFRLYLSHFISIAGSI